MTEPITCPRCRRAFGGEQAYRRGHRRYHGDGKGVREKCRPVRELRRDWILRVDADGVWHIWGPTDPGKQLKLPLFGRGRPVSVLPKYYVGTRNRHGYVVRPLPPKRPVVDVLDDENGRAA